MHLGTPNPVESGRHWTQSRPGALTDGFGRAVTYLRLSVTDRCDMRCRYCMDSGTRFLPHCDVLTLEELARIGRIFTDYGVRKIRLTGGEPLSRPNIGHLIAALGDLRRDGCLDELTLTSNGSRLAALADDLVRAGVRRVNVSLDSLDPAKFTDITRFGKLPRVLAGIEAALAHGVAVRVNTVIQSGVNDDELHDMVGWCGERGVDLCLIELMPIGPAGRESGRAIPMPEIRRRLEERWTLTPSSFNSGGPARYVTVAETGRRVGFITALSDCFCGSCNRVRVTCTGTLHPCLAHADGVDLRAALRASSSDDPVRALIERTIGAKRQRHDLERRDGANAMNATGG